MNQSNIEVEKLINECQESLYSLSFVSPNYSSKLFNLRDCELPNDNDADDEIIMSDIVLNAKVRKIIDVKAIKGELCFLVELSNNNLTVISVEAANRLIPDKKMIKFLVHKIKTHKNNSIPKISSRTINDQIPIFNCTYSIVNEKSGDSDDGIQIFPTPPNIDLAKKDDQISVLSPKAKNQKKVIQSQDSQKEMTIQSSKEPKSLNEIQTSKNDQVQQTDNETASQSKKKKRKRH